MNVCLPFLLCIQSITATAKKSPPKTIHDSEFVVGKVKDKTEQEIYAPVASPPKPQPAKATKPGKEKAGKTHLNNLSSTPRLPFYMNCELTWLDKNQLSSLETLDIL